MDPRQQRDTPDSLRILFYRGKQIESLQKRIQRYREDAISSLFLGGPAGVLTAAAAAEHHPLALGMGTVSLGLLTFSAIRGIQLWRAKRELERLLATKKEYRQYLQRALLAERKYQRFDHSTYEKLRKWWRRFNA